MFPIWNRVQSNSSVQAAFSVFHPPPILGASHRAVRRKSDGEQFDSTAPTGKRSKHCPLSRKEFPCALDQLKPMPPLASSLPPAPIAAKPYFPPRGCCLRNAHSVERSLRRASSQITLRLRRQAPPNPPIRALRKPPFRRRRLPPKGAAGPEIPLRARSASRAETGPLASEASAIHRRLCHGVS